MYPYSFNPRGAATRVAVKPLPDLNRFQLVQPDGEPADKRTWPDSLGATAWAHAKGWTLIQLPVDA